MTITKEEVFIAYGTAVKNKQKELEPTGKGYGALEIALERADVNKSCLDLYNTNTILITKRILELSEDGLIKMVKGKDDKQTQLYLTADGLAQYNWIKTK